jgi:hypothetical protein
MYHGWEEWRINFTTFDHVNDPISGFPLLKGVPVRLEKVRASEDGATEDGMPEARAG